MIETWLPMLGVALVGVFCIVMWQLSEPEHKKPRKHKKHRK